jgi:hypothetical protein
MSIPATTPFIAIFQDDIHEAIFQNMRSETLDQYFGYLETVFKTTPKDQRVNILLNASSDLPAFTNLAARDRALRAKFRPAPFVRLAVLYQNQTHLHFINMMLRVINMNSHMKMQIFPAQQKEAAIAWLHH